MRAAPVFVAVTMMATVVAAAMAGPSPAAPADRPSRSAPDVKVAVLSASRCGKFADNTTAAIRISDLDPAEESTSLSLCVTNASRAAGRLLVGSADVVDLDVACSGDEALVDTTCGGTLAGELAADLVHDLRVTMPCAPSRGELGTARSVSFAALADGVVLGTLGRDEMACVSVTLRRPALHGGSSGAQSDRVTWRYRFVLTDD